ncbi:aminodeoxychorismate lyase [Paraglaciecola sp. 2405UD69-4]|uniref:aminodeoxychorismate lyase n=1 Tax=Paraglaciecola sp. 2405UD69-4 TaxID=3391836 RepID=UPI0039C9B884
MIVNGHRQSNISLSDRGLQYGDGCFTTMAYEHGKVELFDAHIQRLKQACKRLSILFKDWAFLNQCILESLHDKQSCVLKVIITRGSGGRGYSPLGANAPTFIISHHPIPNHYTNWQREGITVGLSDIALSRQPLLAGIKHLNRLEQVLIKKSCADTSYDDVIVRDTESNVIETSIGNVFWYENGSWFTPDLNQSGVEGVMRNYVMAKIKEFGLNLNVIEAPIDALCDAKAAFICNSLMKVVPLKSLEDENTFGLKSFQLSPVHEIQSYLNDIPGVFNG